MAKLKRPDAATVTTMSKTLEGAIDAAILKWRWLATTAKRHEALDLWPVCGLCIYRNKHIQRCVDCVLEYCYDNESLYQKSKKAKDLLYRRKITLVQFRKVAKKLLDELRKIKKNMKK